jgi:RNA polymerase-binding protein DksA
VANRTISKKAGSGKVALKAARSAVKATRPKTKAAKASKPTAKVASKGSTVATAKRNSPVKGTSARKNKTAKGKNTTAGKTTKTGPAASTAERKAPLVRKSPGNDGTLPNVASHTRPVKPRKTRLSPAALEEFRQMLLTKRQQLIGDVNHLEDEAIRSGGHGAGGVSAMPIHMADLGSDTWEQELTLGLIENERSLLREIDEALERIENKTYGICLATGKVITKARLRAQPWAKYCIEYAQKRELGLV